MLFESKPAAFQVLVRSEQKIYQGGVHIDTIRPLTAEFAIHEGEHPIENEDGSMQTVAMISGHFLDTKIAQEREGWTDEERDLVEKSLMMQCKRTPEWVWLKELDKPTAPWKNYDKLTNYLEIASLAEKLDMVDETLAYERATKNRDGVVRALQEKVADKTDAESLTAV